MCALLDDALAAGALGLSSNLLDWDQQGRPIPTITASDEEWEALLDVVERYPVNDYAHFCLGRSLEKTGRRAEARRHAALAANMRPDRKDYQAFRDRLQTA